MKQLLRSLTVKLAIAFINLSFPASFLFAQSTVTLDDRGGKTIINKNIYGHFAEHLGHCIYGGFYVGDTSKTIPNTDGVRNDVVAALKKMKIPLLRWPGGCFADTYHWKDGTGPKDKRPTMVNKWWGGVTEDNSFGTHDFLNMCEQLGADPYISGNVGSGTVQELEDWVQYVNFDGKSPMSDLRRENGREKAWNVNYWGIGNEAWGCGGNMTPDYYANEFRKYATFMTDWNNSGRISRIASGASDADYHWTETIMKNIPLNMLWGVGVHHYSLIDWEHKGSATDFTGWQYFQVMKSAWQMEKIISGHAAIMDKYDPNKEVAMCVDEWGAWYDVEPGTNPGFLFQQNTMRDAMIAALTLNIFNNHADRVRLACLAQTINVLQAVILTDGEKFLLTPTYHVMEMYSVHQGATMIPVTVKSDNFIVGKDGASAHTDTLPAVSASASRDSNGATHISLVNIDDKKAQELSIQIDGSKYKFVTGRVLVSGHIQDHNTFAEPEKIKPAAFNSVTLKGSALSLKVPPASVVVLELK